MITETDFKTDLLSILSNHAGLTELVGERVFQSIAIQGTDRPYVVFHDVHGDDEYDQQGDTFGTRRIQFDIVADSPDSCAEVEDQLEVSLSATLQPRTVGDTYFGAILRDGVGSSDYEDSPSSTGGLGVWMKTVDYTFRARLKS